MLLDLERKYAAAVAQLLASRDSAVQHLQARHAAEMEAAAAGPEARHAHRLVAKHMEELDDAERGWETELRLLKTTQRTDYREFVVAYYKDHIEATRDVDATAPAPRPVLAASAPAVPAPTPTAPAVTELVEMGFTAEQAECALMLTEGRKVRASLARCACNLADAGRAPSLCRKPR